MKYRILQYPDGRYGWSEENGPDNWLIYDTRWGKLKDIKDYLKVITEIRFPGEPKIIEEHEI